MTFRRLPLLIALLAVGCQGGSAALAPVSGKVTYKGSPLPGGTIVFTPDASRSERGQLAVGRIQADGTFALRTGEALGARPGWYRITVVSVASSSAPFAAPYSVIPERYRDPELSLLACEVKGQQANAIDIELD